MHGCIWGVYPGELVWAAQVERGEARTRLNDVVAIHVDTGLELPYSSIVAVRRHVGGRIRWTSHNLWVCLFHGIGGFRIQTKT